MRMLAHEGDLLTNTTQDWYSLQYSAHTFEVCGRISRFANSPDGLAPQRYKLRRLLISGKLVASPLYCRYRQDVRASVAKSKIQDRKARSHDTRYEELCSGWKVNIVVMATQSVLVLQS